MIPCAPPRRALSLNIVPRVLAGSSPDPRVMNKRSPSQHAARNAFSVLKHALPESRWADDFLAHLHFYGELGRLPTNPGGYQDRLFRIKTSEEIMSPLRGLISDKELVKIWAGGVAGEDWAIPTLAVLRGPEDLDNYDFPERCAVKATHSCGRIVLRKAGEPLDLDRLRGWFAHNYYRTNREYNYRHLQPKILVEPLIGDGEPLEEFKVVVVDGEPRAVRYFHDRYGGDGRAWLDTELRPVDGQAPLSRPIGMDGVAEMLRLSARLASHLDIIRIDFLRWDGRIYLNEMTNLHACAAHRFDNPAQERAVNALLFG